MNGHIFQPWVIHVPSSSSSLMWCLSSFSNFPKVFYLVNDENHTAHYPHFTTPPTKKEKGKSIISEDVLLTYQRLLESDSGKLSLSVLENRVLYAVSSDRMITNSIHKGKSALACVTWKIEEKGVWNLDYSGKYLFPDIIQCFLDQSFNSFVIFPPSSKTWTNSSTWTFFFPIWFRYLFPAWEIACQLPARSTFPQLCYKYLGKK